MPRTPKQVDVLQNHQPVDINDMTDDDPIRSPGEIMKASILDGADVGPPDEPVQSAETGADPVPQRYYTPVPQRYYTPMTELEVLADESIEAISLTPPNTADVLYLRSGIKCRWINYKAMDGQLLFQARAAGFRFATQHDIESVIQPTNGKFVYGDVVLMKIDEKLYNQALKANSVRARLATGETMKNAMKEIHEVANQGLPRGQKQKITPYVPPLDEVDKLIEAEQAQRSGTPGVYTKAV